MVEDTNMKEVNSSAEIAVPVETVDRARNVLQEKNWYGFKPIGAFDLEKSVGKLTTSLGLPETSVNLVKKALAESFSPDSLSRVSLEKGGKEESAPLLEKLGELDVDMYVWSLGDISWQKLKFERTGANKFISEEKSYFAEVDKHDQLPVAVDRIKGEAQQRNTRGAHVFLVDDKRINVARGVDILKQKQGSDMTFEGFQLRLDDPRADATALYKRVKAFKERNPDKHVASVLDFDGVIADTEGVLAHTAPSKLARVMQAAGVK